jgi:hypothetical protein
MKTKHPRPIEPGPVRPTVLHTNFVMEKHDMDVEPKLYRKRFAERTIVESRDDNTTYGVLPNGSLRRHDRMCGPGGKRLRISKKQRLRIRGGGKQHFAT